MTVAAAIIAGGRARRLGGVVKPFLEVAGVAIADRQLAVLRPLFGRVVAVVADAADAAPWQARGVETVTDAVPGAGPMAGVTAALTAAAPGGVVCIAGDLPFLSPALVTALRDRHPDADALAPRAGGQIEPLCARYGARCLAELSAPSRRPAGASRAAGGARRHGLAGRRCAGGAGPGRAIVREREHPRRPGARRAARAGRRVSRPARVAAGWPRSRAWPFRSSRRRPSSATTTCS